MVRKLDKSDPVLYTGQAFQLAQTEVFRNWLDGLRDRTARLRIDDRIKRLAAGNAGDTRSIGSSVRELRCHFGPGYRIYYAWSGKTLIVLLSGGDKATQKGDIARAKQLAEEMRDGIEGLSL